MSCIYVIYVYIYIHVSCAIHPYTHSSLALASACFDTEADLHISMGYTQRLLWFAMALGPQTFSGDLYTYGELFAGERAWSRGMSLMGYEGKSFDSDYKEFGNGVFKTDFLTPFGFLCVFQHIMSMHVGAVFLAACPCWSWIFYTRYSTGLHYVYTANLRHGIYNMHGMSSSQEAVSSVQCPSNMHGVSSSQGALSSVWLSPTCPRCGVSNSSQVAIPEMVWSRAQQEHFLHHWEIEIRRQDAIWFKRAAGNVWRYLIIRLWCVYAQGGHEQETPLGENEPGQWWPLIFAVSADGQIYPDSDSEIGDDDEECFGDFKHGFGFFYPDTLATASSSSSHDTASCPASSLDGQLPG